MVADPTKHEHISPQDLRVYGRKKLEEGRRKAQKRFGKIGIKDLLMLPRYDGKEVPARFIISEFFGYNVFNFNYFFARVSKKLFPLDDSAIPLPLVISTPRTDFDDNQGRMFVGPIDHPLLNPKGELYHGNSEILKALENTPGFEPHAASLMVALYEQDIHIPHPSPEEIEEARKSWPKRQKLLEKLIPSDVLGDVVTYTCPIFNITFEHYEKEVGAYRIMRCPHSKLVEDTGQTRCNRLNDWCPELHPKPKPLASSEMPGPYPPNPNSPRLMKI